MSYSVAVMNYKDAESMKYLRKSAVNVKNVHFNGKKEKKYAFPVKIMVEK